MPKEVEAEVELNKEKDDAEDEKRIKKKEDMEWRMKEHNDNYYKKFLKIFKNLRINIPLANALEKMPKFMKYFKDIINKKRRLGDLETVTMAKERSASLKINFCQNLKIQGVFGFSIP